MVEASGPVRKSIRRGAQLLNPRQLVLLMAKQVLNVSADHEIGKQCLSPRTSRFCVVESRLRVGGIDPKVVWPCSKHQSVVWPQVEASSVIDYDASVKDDIVRVTRR